MEPTFSGRVIALAFDVFVSDVRVVPAEPGDFLFETKPRVFHKNCVATVPEFAMLFNDPWHPVTRGFDHMFMHHFPVKRRPFPVPVHDLRRFVLIRTHIPSTVRKCGRSGQLDPPNRTAIVELALQFDEGRSIATQNPYLRVWRLLSC